MIHSHDSVMENFKCKLGVYQPREAFELDNHDALWISDESVWAALNSSAAPQELRAALAKIDQQRLILLPSGEQFKTWQQVERILNKGFENGLARDSVMIGLGGGVVTDIAAFAASLYMRGCKLILLPTTVLAMVDAAFGGKTGVNFGGYKNMVGSFFPANEVRVVPEFVQTLSDLEFKSGLAEIIKAALLDDKQLFEYLLNNQVAIQARDLASLEHIIWQGLMVKARIVESDLKEQSIRAHLNLGHTFAHGLEAVAGFGSWTHGEAVAWGIVKALELSVRLGLAKQAYLAQVRDLIVAYGFRIKADNVDVNQLINAMLMDKKKKDGRVHFVLQRGLCDTFLSVVQSDDLLAVLQA